MSRDKYGWGTDKDWQTRQEVAARPELGDDEPIGDEPVLVVTRRFRARKDTRTWCRGKQGRPHLLAIEIPPNAFRIRDRPQCYWVEHGPHTTPWWNCLHVEHCTRCGKVVRRCHGWMQDPELTPQDCPDYEPPPAFYSVVVLPPG